MNILACGDLHGRIASLEGAIAKFKKGRYDALVLMGDYVDSHHMSLQYQLECLKAIAEYQFELGPDVLIPLIGAKDHPAYIYKYWVKGNNKEMASSYAKYYAHAKYQFAWQYDNYLFTHAGINQKWWNRMRHLRWFVDKQFPDDIQNEADLLNKMYSIGMHRLLFDPGKIRQGSCEGGGPLWSDMYENENHRWATCNQVVGHTSVEEIRITDKMGSKIYYIDCLDMNPYMFLELSID